jgi:hypothetical protein
MLEALIGVLGTGKTLMETFEAFKRLNDPLYDVYANFKIKHKRARVIEPDDLFDINPRVHIALVFLDDAQSWLDCRMSMTKVNKYLSQIPWESRKRNMKIVWSSQWGELVDLRLRNLSSKITICEKFQIPFRSECLRCENFDVENVVCKRSGFEEVKKYCVFTYTTFERLTSDVWKKRFSLIRCFKAQDLFKRFDTREIIKRVETLKRIEKARK